MPFVRQAELSIAVPPGEQAIHDFCAAYDYGTDLLAVDDLGCGRAGVADKTNDLLDRDTSVIVLGGEESTTFLAAGSLNSGV